MSDKLTFLGRGSDGLLFAKDRRVFIVWPTTKRNDAGLPDMGWSGLEANSISTAFCGWDGTDFCGAEIDMREDEARPATSEEMDLANEMAEAMNDYNRRNYAEVEAAYRKAVAE